MATRGLRNKSTRLSSPATFSVRDASSAPAQAERTRERPKTLLDTWAEPPLRSPAPSFEDSRGLERVGVLEHMEPLGRPPSQKLMQKFKLGPTRLSQRATPLPNEEVTTPTTEIEKIETGSPGERMARSGSVTADEHEARPIFTRTRSRQDDDGDYRPGNGTTHTVDKGSPSQSGRRGALSSSSTPSNQRLSTEQIKLHVQAAISEAERKNQRDIIPGLTKMRDDASSNPDLWIVFNGVLQKSPSRQEFRIFRRYIKSGIKEQSNTSAAITESKSSAPLKNHHTAPSPTKSTHSLYHLTNSSPKSPQHTSPPKGATLLPFHPQKTHLKTASGTQSSGAAGTPSNKNGAGRGVLQHGHPNAEQEGSTRKARSRSASSSSSLSSAKSLDETFAPTIEIDGTAAVNGSKGAKSAGQRQGPSRVAAGNHNTKTRAAAASVPKSSYSDFITSSKFATVKLKRPRNESEIDQEEFQKRRGELLAKTLHDYNDIPLDESNDRTIVDSGSFLASSSLETVSPPVVHPHHVNAIAESLSSPIEALASSEAVLRNGTSRKRPRNDQENDEEEIPTPASSSPPAALLALPSTAGAATSRAGTPRSTRLPPSKRLKKSARVMVS